MSNDRNREQMTTPANHPAPDGGGTPLPTANVFWVDTIGTKESPGQLRGLSGTEGSIAIAHGFWAAGDGGGGIFWWSSSIGADNDGTVINPSTGGGSWMRLYEGELNVKWFGAKGDRSVNDQPAMQKAMNAIATLGGGTVYIPPGNYRLDSSITVTANNTRIRGAGSGNGNGSHLYPTTYNPAIWGGDTGAPTPPCWEHCIIEDLGVFMFSSTTIPGTSYGLILSAFTHSLVRNVKIVLNTAEGARSRGILLQGNATTSGGHYNQLIQCDILGVGKQRSPASEIGIWFAPASTAIGGAARVCGNANQIIGGSVTGCTYAVWFDGAGMNIVDGLVTEGISHAHYLFYPDPKGGGHLRRQPRLRRPRGGVQRQVDLFPHPVCG